MRGRIATTFCGLLLVAVVATGGGCKSAAVWLPAAADSATRTDGGERVEYLVGRDLRIVEERDASGRTVAFEVTRSASGLTTTRIEPAKVDASRRRHLVIAMDGAPYALVQELHEKGMLPAFWAPTPMVSVYPAMSDIAFARILGGGVPMGFEAEYYNRERRRLSDGNAVYIAGTNEPWSERLDYRLTNFWSAVQYVNPRPFFYRELENILKRLRKCEKETFIAYLASTAGMGTRYGREGYAEALFVLDRLARQLMIESEGEVTVTLLADHGHTMLPAKRAPIEKFLIHRGWRVVKQLKRERDVVPVRFGLVTYAAFHTDSSADLAAALIEMPQAELASFPDGDDVVVMSREGRARITKRGGRYRYDSSGGDPLGLAPIIGELKAQGNVDADGFIDDRAMLEATFAFAYPDPLKRVWESFHGLAQHPADVLVSLKDHWYYGRENFEGATPRLSTHGGLGGMNGTAFVMSTAGRIEKGIRVGDFRDAVKSLGIHLNLEGKGSN